MAISAETRVREFPDEPLKRDWQVSVPGMPYNIVREEEYNHVPYCYRKTQTRKVPFGEGNSEAEAGQGVLLGVSSLCRLNITVCVCI